MKPAAHTLRRAYLGPTWIFLRSTAHPLLKNRIASTPPKGQQRSGPSTEGGLSAWTGAQEDAPGRCQAGKGERRVVHGGRAAPSIGRTGSARGQQASGSPISFQERLSRWVRGVRQSPKGLSQSLGERTKPERKHLEMFMEN